MKTMDISHASIPVFLCCVIVHMRVAIARQYLVKCSSDTNTCLNDLTSKGFIAKQTNVPGFYSAEDTNSTLNTTDDNTTGLPDPSSTEDPISSKNDTLEHRIPMQETSVYRFSEKIKSSKIESKNKSKLQIVKGVELVEEQTYEKRVKKTQDAYWINMWEVNGDVVPSMKVMEAWNMGYSGRGIYIAVVDDGVETVNKDLLVNTGSDYHYDYIDDDDDPSPALGDTHGTNCAGLVGAEKDNNLCIVGIAYHASIVGIRLLDKETTDLMEGNALSHLISKIDIYSNSWGPVDGYGFSNMRTLAKAAIEKGIQMGRNGKGSIYVWAAGNGGLYDNCNADGYVNSIYTIGITSINSNNQSAYYAEVCAPVLATSYGGGGGSYKYLYSTSQSNMCTGNHSGTSFSAPQAAAIIALALEANPDLIWRDVQHIIVRTSNKYDLEDGIFDWAINGAKRYVHPVLGFGLMDAEDMVKTSRTWRNVPAVITYTTLTSNPYRYISPWSTQASATDWITVQKSDTNIRYLEHVVIWVYFESKSNGDTSLLLTSPDGTISYLLTPRYMEAGQGLSLKWNYMTVHHWGESPIGTWTLRMLIYTRYYYGGTLYSWQITFYGTYQDPVYGSQPGTTVTSTNATAYNRNATSATTGNPSTTRGSIKSDHNPMNCAETFASSIFVGLIMIVVIAGLFA